jgi:PAS domain S-box-containing protein
LSFFGHTAPTTQEWYQIAYPDPEYRKDVVDRWKPFVSTARSSGQTVNAGEYKVTCRDGSVSTCELYARFITDYLLVTFNNITERKKAEEQLRLEKEFIDEALDAQMDTFFLFEPAHGKALRWNQAFTNISGYTDNEIAGMPAPASYYGPEDLERATVFVEKVLEEGKGTIELDLICKDGRKIPTEYRVSVINDDQGEPKYIIAIGRDITERKKAEAALQKSESRFRELVENLNDVIFSIDLNGTISYVSPPIERVLGYSPSELVGLKFHSLIHHDDLAEIVQSFQDVLENRLHPSEFRIQAKSGEYRWVRSSSRPILKNGKPIGINGVFTDITDRKSAEEALRESERRFKSMFQKHDAVMLLIDPETGQILEANPAAERFYGYQIPDLLHMSIQEINMLSPDQVAREREKALREEKNYFIFEHRLAGGEERAVEVHSSPIDYGGKQILFSIIHDVTQRKRAEQKLRDSEARLRLAQDAAKAGTWEWNLNTNENFWSDEIWPLYGLEHNSVEASYEAWRQSIHPDDREEVERTVLEASENAAELNAEWRTNHPEGIERWLKSRGRPIFDENGQAVKYIGIVMDITDRKRAEIDIKRRVDELERFNRAMVDRELRMIELKKEINELLKQAGREEKYRIVE